LLTLSRASLFHFFTLNDALIFFALSSFSIFFAIRRRRRAG
jgi:hypothetical protein